ARARSAKASEAATRPASSDRCAAASARATTTAIPWPPTSWARCWPAPSPWPPAARNPVGLGSLTGAITPVGGPSRVSRTGAELREVGGDLQLLLGLLGQNGQPFGGVAIGRVVLRRPPPSLPEPYRRNPRKGRRT